MNINSYLVFFPSDNCSFLLSIIAFQKDFSNTQLYLSSQGPTHLNYQNDTCKALYYLIVSRFVNLRTQFN